jgi:DNA uptake protein ComE-like DNA-binding protein
MNALSTRRSESTGYVHPISRMAVDAKGTPAIWKLMNATPACLRAENVARRPGEQQRTYQMSTRRVLVTSAMLALLSAPAFAQGMQPTAPAHPAPSAAAPAKPATTGAATHPVTAKVNLNTATVAELDKVSQIGPARSKAIVEARTKEKFKNWDDFVARKVVPADAAAAMKDVVSF